MDTLFHILSKCRKSNRPSQNQQPKDRHLFVGCSQLSVLWINTKKHLKLPSGNTENTWNLFSSLTAAHQQTTCSSPTLCLTSSIFYIKTDEQVDECCADTVRIVISRYVGTREKSNGQGLSSPYHSHPKGFEIVMIILCLMAEGHSDFSLLQGSNSPLNTAVKELPSCPCLELFYPTGPCSGVGSLTWASEK